MPRKVERPEIRPDEMPTIEELAARFAAHRRRSGRMARVPAGLREAIVSAIRGGVPSSRLRRACGVSTSQLKRWQSAHQPAARTSGEVPQAQVFTVVDEVPPSTPPPVGRGAVDGLELRVGPWSVCVRLTEAATAAPGEQSCYR